MIINRGPNPGANAGSRRSRALSTITSQGEYLNHQHHWGRTAPTPLERNGPDHRFDHFRHSQSLREHDGRQDWRRQDGLVVRHIGEYLGQTNGRSYELRVVVAQLFAFNSCFLPHKISVSPCVNLPAWLQWLFAKFTLRSTEFNSGFFCILPRGKNEHYRQYSRQSC